MQIKNAAKKQTVITFSPFWNCTKTQYLKKQVGGVGVGQTAFKNHDKERERRQQQQNLGNCKAYEVVKDSTDKKTEYAISNAGIRLYHRTPPKRAVTDSSGTFKNRGKTKMLGSKSVWQAVKPQVPLY